MRLGQALPRDPKIEGDATDVSFADRKELYVDFIETQFLDQLFDWYTAVQPIYDYQFEMVGLPDVQAEARLMAAQVKRINAPPDDPGSKAGDKGVVGPGWVVEIKGHHFHNSREALDRQESAEAYIVKTLLRSLVSGTVRFPGAENEIEGGGEFKFSDVGVFYPTLIGFSRPEEVVLQLPSAVETPAADAAAGDSAAAAADAQDPDRGGAPGNAAAAETGDAAAQPPADAGGGEKVLRCDFTVQLVWIPRSRKDRVAAKELRVKAEAAAQATAAPAAGGGATQ